MLFPGWQGIFSLVGILAVIILVMVAFAKLVK